MLDDLYKNAVVSITKRYVNKQDKRPAIMVAQDVFGAMRKQGWHSAKLVDATGEPLNDANAPEDRLREGGGTRASGRASRTSTAWSARGRTAACWPRPSSRSSCRSAPSATPTRRWARCWASSATTSPSSKDRRHRKVGGATIPSTSIGRDGRNCKHR